MADIESSEGGGARPTGAGGSGLARPLDPPPLLYLHGEFMPLAEGRISVEDRGLQLGDGVYEVLKVANGRLLWLADHLDRLRWSLEKILLPEALDGHPLERILPELVERSGVEEGSTYVQVTRGVAPRDFALPEASPPTVLAYVRGHGFPDDDEIRAGIALHAVEDIRWARCDIKSTNLLAAVLAKDEARRAGAEEALYVGPDGRVREGGSSNVFAVVEGALRTHPADARILNGITRCHVIDAARSLGYRVMEEPVLYADLPGAEEVFIASTTRDVMPVVRLGGLGLPPRPVNGGTAGPVTLAVADALRRLVAEAVGLPAPPSLKG